MMRKFMLTFVLLGAMVAIGCSSKSTNQELTAKVDNSSTKVITCDVEGMTCNAVRLL